MADKFGVNRETIRQILVEDLGKKKVASRFVSPASSKGKKVRLQKSKVKKMLLCFYENKGVIHHEIVPEGQTVTGSFYMSVLERLWKRIRRVQPEYSAPGSWFLLHDNARFTGQLLYKNFLPENKCACSTIRPTPLIYPFLFPKPKLLLKGRLFEDVQDIQATVTSSLRAIPQEDVQKSFQSLLDRATRCIDAEGMYFE